MHCPNCGKEIIPNTKFCGGCGAPIPEAASNQETTTFQPVKTVTPPVQETAYVQPPVRETYERDVMKSTKVPTGVKVLVGVLVSIVVIGGIFIALLLGTDLFDGKAECEFCGEKIEKGEDFCEDCIEDYTCGKCDKVDENVESGVCPECLEDVLLCKRCDDEIEKGWYCSDCITHMKNKTGWGEECLRCGSFLDDDEIYLMSEKGFLFCEDCDTGKYCTSCDAVLEKDDDDKVCMHCAEYSCYSCDEVLDEDETVINDEYGNYYCLECGPQEYCTNCGAPVGEEGAYVDYEGEHWCNSCYVGNTNYSVNPGTVATCWFCGIDVDGRRVYRDRDSDFWCVKCVVENGEGMAY